MPRKSSTRRAQPTLLYRIEPFEDDCVMVVIETLKGSPNKLAFEPRYGTFVLKGVLPAGAASPSTSVSCRPRVPRTAIRSTCWS
jgi:hypothetical protein